MSGTKDDGCHAILVRHQKFACEYVNFEDMKYVVKANQNPRALLCNLLESKGEMDNDVKPVRVFVAGEILGRVRYKYYGVYCVTSVCKKSMATVQENPEKKLDWPKTPMYHRHYEPSTSDEIPMTQHEIESKMINGHMDPKDVFVFSLTRYNGDDRDQAPNSKDDRVQIVNRHDNEAMTRSIKPSAHEKERRAICERLAARESSKRDEMKKRRHVRELKWQKRRQ